MLTYTFSTREKFMLALLAFVAVGILWYQFVFVNIQNQIAQIDADIATAQDQILVYQTQAANLDTMRALVEEYQQQGVQPVALPTFDNTQNLMAYLNGVLSGTQGYSMSFDNPSLSDSDGNIHRSGTITFGSMSYGEARGVIQNIARGPYPCQITALGITDNSARSSGSGASVTTNLQVTYFETPSEGTKVESEDTTPEGQDLSQLSKWDS